MVIADLCKAVGCRTPARSLGYCDKHLKRWQRHGHVEQTRPADWGAREKHPLYSLWTSLRRGRDDILGEVWRNDFWAFANEVGSRPSEKPKPYIERLDESLPLGPGNWFWARPKRTCSVAHAEDRNAYMREYNRKRAQDDPAYLRDQSLRKHYGINTDDYDRMYAAQGGVCKICRKPETLVIKGRLCKLAVDHCHETGKVRGLLCSKCNRALGLLKHDKALFARAIEYLDLT